MLSLVLLLAVGGARDAGVDPWTFEGLRAKVFAKGVPRDALTTSALSRLGLQLEGAVTLSVSAGVNTVGGVTLRLADPSDASARCDLYASREGEGLRFTDNRCSFPAFSGKLRTTATCRKLSGVARRSEDGIVLEISSPDCTAQPLGLPLSLSGTLTPR